MHVRIDLRLITMDMHLLLHPESKSNSIIASINGIRSNVQKDKDN